MRAKVGDWIVVKSRTIDTPEQRGQILEVHSTDGTPPYVVKWLADDHISVYFPAADAVVLTADELVVADERARRRFAATQDAIAVRNVHPKTNTHNF